MIQHYRAIVERWCRALGVECDAVIGAQRWPKSVVEARMLICYLLRTEQKLSLPGIGRVLNRDHTTVLHAIRKVDDALLQRKAWAVLGMQHVEAARMLPEETVTAPLAGLERPLDSLARYGVYQQDQEASGIELAEVGT